MLGVVGGQYVKRIMASLSAVARTLGVSERAVRLRLDALGAVVGAHVHRAHKNALELDGSAVAMLRRLEDVRRAEGLTVRQAAARIRAEIDGNGAEDVRQTAPTCTSNGELVEELRAHLAAREAEVRRLEAEAQRWHRHAERLQAKLDEVMQLARAFSWFVSARN